MHSIFKQLADDHINISYVMIVLAKHASQWQNIDDIRSDLDFIQDSLHYLSDYPQLCHHPIEEQLFDYIEENKLCDPTIFSELRAEHKELETITNNIKEQFQAFSDDQKMGGFEELKQSTVSFIRSQQEHVKNEDTLILPEIDRAMSEEHWREFTTNLNFETDPVFGGIQCEKISQLLRSIIKRK